MKQIEVFCGGYENFIIKRGKEFFSVKKEGEKRVLSLLGQADDDSYISSGYRRQPFSKGLWIQFYILLQDYDKENPPKGPHEVQGSLFDLPLE